MNLINVRRASQINVKHVRVAKIRVHANQTNVKPVNLAKIRVHAKVIVLNAVIVTAIVVPVLLQVQKSLWRMACGSLLKRLQQENMYRGLMA